jgi:hypothetical protein
MGRSSQPTRTPIRSEYGSGSHNQGKAPAAYRRNKAYNSDGLYKELQKQGVDFFAAQVMPEENFYPGWAQVEAL